MGFDPKTVRDLDIPTEALGLILHADLKTRHLVEGLDRFGLPRNASLLELPERMPTLERLAHDTVETLVRWLGHNIAREMLTAALRQPAKGKRANRKENEGLLAAYDAEVSAGTAKRLAARATAEKIATGANDDAESVAKRIRTLAKARDAERARRDAWFRRVGSSLITDSNSEF